VRRGGLFESSQGRNAVQGRGIELVMRSKAGNYRPKGSFVFISSPSFTVRSFKWVCIDARRVFDRCHQIGDGRAVFLTRIFGRKI